MHSVGKRAPCIRGLGAGTPGTQTSFVKHICILLPCWPMLRGCRDIRGFLFANSRCCDGPCRQSRLAQHIARAWHTCGDHAHQSSIPDILAERARCVRYHIDLHVQSMPSRRVDNGNRNLTAVDSATYESTKKASQEGMPSGVRCLQHRHSEPSSCDTSEDAEKWQGSWHTSKPSVMADKVRNATQTSVTMPATISFFFPVACRGSTAEHVAKRHNSGASVSTCMARHREGQTQRMGQGTNSSGNQPAQDTICRAS
jgi:hypothetical protein